MAYDIGPKIGIDGEAEFRKAIQDINMNLKTLGTEMQAVSSAFDKGDQSEEKMTATSEVLQKQIEQQKEKLEQCNIALQAAKDKYGENDTVTQKWQQTVNRATADLNNMERELGSVGENLDETGEKSSRFGDLLKANLASEVIVAGVKALASAVVGVAKSIIGLDESTAEFREAQARITTAFEQTGKTAEQAKGAYTEFYKILGDTDTAAEATQLLSNLASSEEELSQWTTIATGVNARFGDSIPIEGLIEASNETAKVGQVTGVLADALNWVGVNEEEFNAKLSACGSEQERSALLTETLTGLYQESADAYRENNAALMEAREAQTLLDTALGSLGGTVANVKNQLIGEFGPAAAAVITAFADMIAGSTGAEDALKNSVNAMVADVTAALPEFIAKGMDIIMSIAEGVVENLPTILEAGFEILFELIAGIAEKIPDLIPTVVEVITQITETIADNLPAVIAAAVLITGAIIKGLIQAIPTLVKNVPKIITAIVNALKIGFSQFTNIGKNIVQGIWNGIQSAVSWLTGKIKGFCNNIVNSVKNVLGIHSPSTVFAGMGKNMALGMGEGFSAEMKDVEKQIKDAVPTSFEGQVTAEAVTENLINGLASVSTGGERYTITVPINLDGRTIAQVAFDPLDELTKQRRVALG